MLKGTQAYVQTKFSTVGQGEILILLYDGAIKFLRLAKEKIKENDPAAKGMLISRALDIVNELDSSINMEAGGSLSKNLHQLYFVCSTRLLKANLHMDAAGVDSVIDILTGLRNAYADILNKPEAKAASAKIASRLPANAATPNRAVPLPNPAAPLAPASLGLAGLHAQNASPRPVDSEGVEQPETTGGASGMVNPTAPVPPLSMENRRFAAAARYGKIAQTM